MNLKEKSDLLSSEPLSSDALTQWIGSQEESSGVVSKSPITALNATLDWDCPEPEIGSPLPYLWHWLYFLPTPRASDTRQDGHQKTGGFLPPVPLPRRMWAGGRLSFHQPLKVGDKIRRLSTMTQVNSKQGRKGPLVFVTIEHKIYSNGILAITEEQDLVYRAEPLAVEAAGEAPREAPSKNLLQPISPQWSKQVLPDPVLLFRYSALTFNSHRIHYDRDYAMNEEHYPGIVVQGPLAATLLMDLLRREQPEAQISNFSFRAISPLFADNPIQIQGRQDGKKFVLEAVNPEGALAMRAEATLR